MVAARIPNHQEVEERKDEASISPIILPRDNVLKNESIVPSQNGPSIEVVGTAVKEDHSSDDEIQMDDLGEESTTNIVRPTVKN